PSGREPLHHRRFVPRSACPKSPLKVVMIVQFQTTGTGHGVALFRVATLLLARPLAGECLLGPALIARLQIERVLLDVLDDVFLLDLPLEAAKRAFDRLAILNFDFGQSNYTPSA